MPPEFLTGDPAAIFYTLLQSALYSQDVEEYNRKQDELRGQIEGLIGDPRDSETTRLKLADALNDAAKEQRQSNRRLLRGYGDRERDVLSYLDSSLDDQQRGYGTLQSDVDSLLSSLETDVSGGYEGLRERLMGYLSSESDQQQRDIAEAYASRESDILQNLASRGLAGTILPGQASLGVERERSAEMRRLSDDLQRRYADIDQSTSGARLSALERIRQDRAARRQAIGQGALDAYGQGSRFRTATQAQLAGDRLSAEERAAERARVASLNARLGPLDYDRDQLNTLIDFYRNDISYAPPNPNNLGGNLAGIAVATPEPLPEPNWFERFGGDIIGGGARLTSAKMFYGQCIDAHAWITTGPGRRKKLRNIKIGEEVLTPQGTIDRVIGIDVGQPWKERENDFVRITHGNFSLVCTRDHVINGIPAGDWNSARPVKPRECGDLVLEVGEDYLVDGIAVRTMHSKEWKHAHSIS